MLMSPVKEDDGVGAPSRDRGPARVLVAVVALVAVLLVPLVVYLVRVWTMKYVSTGDIALIELRTRDVGGGSTPLVGPFSRYGWDHPGPLLFYVLAVPYRLLGGSWRGLLTGGVLIDAVAILAVLWLLWRRAGLIGVLLGSLVLGVLLRAFILMVFPWNPWVVVIPMLLLALCTWSILCGDYWFLPMAVAVGTFVVQSHVGTALAAGVLVLTGTVAVVIAARRDRLGKDAPRLLSVSAFVALILWLPPILEQFRGGGGNLGRVWSFFTATHKTVGYANAARLTAPQLSFAAPWITGHERMTLGALDPAWTVPFVLFLLIGALVIAIKRRDHDALVLDALALGFAVVAWVSAARIVGEPFPYVLQWTWIVGVLAWLAIGFTALRAIRLPSPLVVAVTAVVLVAVTISAAGSAAHDDLFYGRFARDAEPLLPVTVAAAKHLRTPMLITNGPGDVYQTVILRDALLLALVKADVRAGFGRGYEWMVGSSHVIDGRSARTVLTTVSDPFVERTMRDPHYRLIARHNGVAVFEVIRPPSS
jgi:hypothetical protein